MSTPASPLPSSLERLVNRLQQASSPKQRYEYLLWLAKRLPPFPESEKIPENKVPGCVSQVYLTAHLESDTIVFQADSDAQITKGLVALLVEGLKGLSYPEIKQLNPDFIQRTGLDISLTPSRVNGFYNIFQTLQKKALLTQQEVTLDTEN